MFLLKTVFLKKFLDNKPKGFLIDDSDDIDCDLDMKLELLTMMNMLTMDMMSHRGIHLENKMSHTNGFG